MKVLDQMTGMKAAAGDPIIHMGLLIGVLFVPTNQSCNGTEYGLVIKLLVASHLVNALRFLVSSFVVQLMPLMPKKKFIMYFVEKVLDTMGIVL